MRIAIIGTADEEQILIRANATQSNSNPLIKVENSAGSELFSLRAQNSSSFFLGVGAGSAISSGTANTGIGVSTLANVTTQTENTAIGAYVLQSSVTVGNTGVGAYALSQASTGSGGNSDIGQLPCRWLHIHSAIGKYQAAVWPLHEEET